MTDHDYEAETDEAMCCEFCDDKNPIETMDMMGEGGWICHKCSADFRDAFNACDHKWLATEFGGDDGFVCDKCSGFITTDEHTLRYGVFWQRCLVRARSKWAQIKYRARRIRDALSH